MKTCVSVYVLAIVISIQSYAQMKVIGKAEFQGGELMGKRDVNDEICAGLIVLTDLDNLTFNSNNGIVDIDGSHPGRYFLFLSPDERVVTVFKTGYEPLKIILSEYGISKMESGKTWQIRVTGEAKVDRSDKDMFDVSFTLNVDGVYASYNNLTPMLQKEKMISYKLPKGTHSFLFQKTGYTDESRIVDVSKPEQIVITLLQGSSGRTKLVLPGIVTIESTPENAEIILNGQKLQNTPFQGELEPGAYRLEIRKPLYNVDITNFTVESGKTKAIKRSLIPCFGYVAFSANVSTARVAVDNKPLGTVPIIPYQIESSKHIYRVEAELYRPYESEFTIKDGLDTTINVTLKPAFGALSISSSPEQDAEVFLDDKRVGTTPYSDQKLASGKYVLRVKKDFYKLTEEEIIITDGQTNTKTILLNKNYGEVSINAPNCEIFVNETPIGRETYASRLLPGKYIIKAVRGPQYYPAEKEIILAVGQIESVALEPEAKQGSLSVIVEPIEAKNTEISVGDQLLGNAPLAKALMIGEYSITARHSNYLGQTQRVIIKENEKAQLKFILITYQGSLQQERDMWGTYKWIGVAASALATGAAGYFYYQKEDNYKKYQTAGSYLIADTYRNRVTQNTLYMNISLGVSLGSVASLIYSWIRQSGVKEYKKDGPALTQANVKSWIPQIGVEEYKKDGSAPTRANIKPALDDMVFVEGGPGGDFYIGKTEVTFEQFDTFCDATGYNKPKADFGRGKQPVINVNVSDAVAYCQWVSKETGTTVRLPEENEWEYAARGGKKSKRYEYSGSNTVGDVAWYGDNSGRKTHEVATKRPNELGLYDMSGNVWEWCGTHGVIRGGSWSLVDYGCRVSSRRDASDPDDRYYNRGFRLLQKQILAEENSR